MIFQDKAEIKKAPRTTRELKKVNINEQIIKNEQVIKMNKLLKTNKLLK